MSNRAHFFRIKCEKELQLLRMDVYDKECKAMCFSQWSSRILLLNDAEMAMFRLVDGVPILCKVYRLEGVNINPSSHFTVSKALSIPAPDVFIIQNADMVQELQLAEGLSAIQSTNL